MPQQVVLTQSRRWLRSDEGKPAEIKANTTIEDQQGWAIEACRELLARDRHAANLHVTFSDLWARYDLIQLGEADVSDEEAMSLARAQFSRHYPGAESASWPLRLVRQGKRMLVAGMDPSLLAALEQMGAASDKRLMRVEPLFANVFDQYEKELAGSDGWILFDEPGVLIAAFMEQGQIFSLHCQRSDEGNRGEAAHLLLDRQAALISRPAGKVRVFSFSGVPLALRKPWLGGYFRTVGPGNGHIGASSPHIQK